MIKVASQLMGEKKEEKAVNDFKKSQTTAVSQGCWHAFLLHDNRQHWMLDVLSVPKEMSMHSLSDFSMILLSEWYWYPIAIQQEPNAQLSCGQWGIGGE